MFCDITWGAGGSTADLTLDIASKMQNMARPRRRAARHAADDARALDERGLRTQAPNTRRCTHLRFPQICVETMMHLTCTNMPRDSLKAALDKARAQA